MVLAFAGPRPRGGEARPDYFTSSARPLQRKCAACGDGAPSCPGCNGAEEPLQRKNEGGERAGSVIPHSVPVALRSPAEPLDPGTRASMERSLGHDLSGVRVHHGAEAARSARDVNALAYTVGRQVVFGEGRYDPSSTGGRELLAHELVHVIQQAGGVQGKRAISEPGDADERQADALGPKVARGEVVNAPVGAGGPAVHRSVNATAELRPDPPDPDARALLVHLHTNEQNAAATAASMFATRCTNFVNLGGAVATASPPPREIEVTAGSDTISVDPNRIFTPAGRAAQIASGVGALPARRRAAAQAALGTELDAFASDLIDKIGRGRLGPGSSLLGRLPVVAFHNNVAGDARRRFRRAAAGVPGQRPGLSIRSYLDADPLQPGRRRGDEAGAADPRTPPHIASGQSEDDFFLTTDASDFSELAAGRVTSGTQRNVVLQGPSPTRDGSLSEATAGAAASAAAGGTLPAGVTARQAGRYINIEAGGKAPDPRVLATNTAMAEDALDLVGAGRRSNHCAVATPTPTPSPTPAPTPTPTPSPTPRIMRQEDPAGSTRVARPADTVDGEAVSGNNPPRESWLEWLIRAVISFFRLLSRLGTLPPTRSPQPVPPSRPGCRTFADAAAVNARKQAWINLLAGQPPADIISWIVGFGTGTLVGQARAEAGEQVLCMLRAMQASGSVANLPTGAPSLAAPWVVSSTRDFARQQTIWNCKYNFLPAADTSCERSFGRVSPEAVAACPTAGLVEGGEWNRGNNDHRTCWTTVLTPDQRQREILTTSSAPGMSRHHQGTDFDLLGTRPADFEGGRRFADAYSWLQANAIQYGFIQTFDLPATFMRLGYTEERWHWSYYPIAQALLEFARDNLHDLDQRLQREWGTSPQFSFIRDHWQEFLFNVHQTPTSPPALPPATAPTPSTTPTPPP